MQRFRPDGRRRGLRPRRTVYDNYYGDPRVEPNPNLGPLERGPFTAVQLVPGDLGTKGGLLTDEEGRAGRHAAARALTTGAERPA